MLNQTMAGLFATRREAEAVIDELKAKGFSPNDISVLVQEDVVKREDVRSTTDNVIEKAGSGTATGAALGGILGLLVGIGALAIPGVGALFIAGPIAAALGLTGAAATTVSGVLSGALAGGFLGALVGLGFTPEDAQMYEERIKAGDVMVAVSVKDATVVESDIRNVFQSHGAAEVRMIHTSSTG